MQNEKVLADLRAGEASVNWLAFNPEVYTLATATSLKSFCYWDLENFDRVSFIHIILDR